MQYKYCSNCGNKLSNADNFCPSCGQSQQGSYYKGQSTQYTYDQAGCFTVGLAFLIPLIGLILYLVWFQTRPQSAKTVGIAALIGFIVDIILYGSFIGIGAYY